MKLTIICRGNPQMVDGHLFDRFYAKDESTGQLYNGWLTEDCIDPAR